MKALPANVTAYKRTPDFTETTIPSGLLKAHSTKAGTWGEIVVLAGRLLYRSLDPEIEELELHPSLNGVIEPEALHEVAPIGQVKFYVQFYR